jgi:hypothetical protein
MDLTKMSDIDIKAQLFDLQQMINGIQNQANALLGELQKREIERQAKKNNVKSENKIGGVTKGKIDKTTTDTNIPTIDKE